MSTWQHRCRVGCMRLVPLPRSSGTVEGLKSRWAADQISARCGFGPDLVRIGRRCDFGAGMRPRILEDHNIAVAQQHVESSLETNVLQATA